MPPQQKRGWSVVESHDVDGEGASADHEKKILNIGRNQAATEQHGRSSKKLIRAVSSCYPSPLPFHLKVLARTTALVVPALFYIGPIMLIAPIFLFFMVSTRAACIVLLMDLLLAYWPATPWPRFRHYFQLWYELYDFHHNMDFDQKASIEDTSLVIYATHPHGVIPIHGYLWCAFCDQYFPQRYGFGALTDIAMRLPLLRQVMGWLSSDVATKSVLKYRMNVLGQNLYILPGGVSEIFLACPGRHVIKSPRRGLMKLALQTGAVLVPTYVFGANEFYDQLATFGKSDSKQQTKDGPTNFIGKIQRKISRSVRGGFTFFWGQYGTTLPYESRCSMVLGDPIQPVPGTLGQESSAGKMTCRKIAEPTEEQIDDLWNRYTNALISLFEQYKAEAGFPDAELILE